MLHAGGGAGFLLQLQGPTYCKVSVQALAFPIHHKELQLQLLVKAALLSQSIRGLRSHS